MASGLDGIANKIEPPAIFEGDIYEAAELPTVPQSLGDAVELFASSDFAEQTLGADVVLHVRGHDARAFARQMDGRRPAQTRPGARD